MNRADLQFLAAERIRDAKTLLDGKRWSGAYYLAGYAVECALKACIARKTREFDFPDKLLANQSHTHDLERLLGLAGLRDVFEAEFGRDFMFAENWIDVTLWSEDSRYQPSGQAEAHAMLKAVGDPQNGILRCIKKHW